MHRGSLFSIILQILRDNLSFVSDMVMARKDGVLVYRFVNSLCFTNLSDFFKIRQYETEHVPKSGNIIDVEEHQNIDKHQNAKKRVNETGGE